MTILENLNMKFVNANDEGNEEIDGGAILRCSNSWTVEKLGEWLADYDFEMLEAVKDWLSDPSQIAEGQFLKVWVD